MAKIEAKRALITGASSGIGAEFAKILASRGIDLVIASRNLKKLGELKKELETRYSVRVDVISSDLSRPGAAAKLFADCAKKKLDIDLLVNNAGTGLFGLVSEQKTEDLESMVMINDVSLTALCNLFGSAMARKGRGRILNVGSLVGYLCLPYFSAYAASKSYVLSFSVSLNRELKKKGVQVTCLLPGYVRTNFDKNSRVKGKGYRAFSEMNAMAPEKVAMIGLKGLFAKKTVVIAGIRNKVFSVFARLLPRTWTASLMMGSIGAMTKN